jgi:2-polyprenyl-6-methoxyphenol hydroxylase-like FAD-dependent oxidoreductase
MQQHASPEVFIVGAGPSALTLVCELLRRGVTCRIVERAVTPAATSRAIGLQARTLEVFANMGIVESAQEQGVSGIHVNVYSDNHLAFQLKFSFLVDDSMPYPYGVLLPYTLPSHTLLCPISCVRAVAWSRLC